jgi:hypothetical protein
MMFVILPRHAGTWPNGEPQSVRDAADGNHQPQPYEVSLVVIGTDSSYEAVAAYKERAMARLVADVYNDLYASRCGHPECRAHVEEISLYPAGSAPIPVIS